MTSEPLPYFQRAVIRLVTELKRRSDECPNTLPALGCLESAAETAVELLEAYTHNAEWCAEGTSAAGEDVEIYRAILADLRPTLLDLERRSLALLVEEAGA